MKWLSRLIRFIFIYRFIGQINSPIAMLQTRFIIFQENTRKKYKKFETSLYVDFYVPTLYT